MSIEWCFGDGPLGLPSAWLISTATKPSPSRSLKGESLLGDDLGQHRRDHWADIWRILDIVD